MNRDVRVWNAENKNLLFKLSGHIDEMCAVVFHPTENLLLSASEDLTIKIWDLATGRLFRSMVAHTKNIRYIAISPDGKLLVSVGDDDIRLWDFATLTKIKNTYVCG